MPSLAFRAFAHVLLTSAGSADDFAKPPKPNVVFLQHCEAENVAVALRRNDDAIDTMGTMSWLGNLDSNQDRRSQSPLFYR
jgi:hypothetical protein